MAEKKTVLVVDDDELMRMLLWSLLKNEFRVLTCENGRDALLCCEMYGETLDLVITDWHMPFMRGDELVRRLRRRFPDLPMLLVTAESWESGVRELVTTEGIRFLPKPFEIHQIKESIKNLISSRSANESNLRMATCAV